MIYILFEKESGLYKVGKARDRHSAIRSRMPSIAKDRRRKLHRNCTLSLVQWIDWPGSYEMKIHRYLWRAWDSDEWFKDCPELRHVRELGLDGIGHAIFDRDFQSAASQCPGPWNWRNRDQIIASHQERNIVR